MAREEFFASTPRQIDALLHFRPRAERELELMLAQLTAATVNRSYRAPKEPAQVKEFMLRRDGAEAPLAANTDERKRRVLTKLAGYFDSITR